MKTNILFTISCLLFIFRTGNAQDSSFQKLPMQISFISPFGTSGLMSPKCEYRFSLNILLGITGRISGAEIASLGNINKSHVKGFQAAGLFNVSGGHSEGARLAGLLNISRQESNGLGAAGLFNISRGMKGAHFAGLGNISIAESKGVAAAGVMNIVSGPSAGSSLAGVFNYRHQDHSGFSAAGIFNYTGGKNKGVQLAGIFNHAKILKGVQISLINIADTVESGVNIGLINIVRKGAYRELELSFADYQQLGLSFRTGTSRFYNIYSIGYNVTNDRLWSLGIGFGHTAAIGRHFFLQPEIISYNYAPENFRDLKRTAAYHLRLGICYKLTEHFAVALTPGLYYSDRQNRKNNTEGYQFTSLQPAYEGSGYGNKWGIGGGVLLGLKFRF